MDAAASLDRRASPDRFGRIAALGQGARKFGAASTSEKHGGRAHLHGVSVNRNKFPATPENSAALWTTYAIPPEFTIGGGANAAGKACANVNNTQYAPCCTRFDTMASDVVNRTITLPLDIRNLNDQVYFDRVSPPHYAGVGAGRAATLTANMTFQATSPAPNSQGLLRRAGRALFTSARGSRERPRWRPTTRFGIPCYCARWPNCRPPACFRTCCRLLLQPYSHFFCFRQVP